MPLSIETRKILIAGTSTEVVNLANYVAGSFSVPAAFTGTTIQPQYSNNNINWTSVGTPIAVTPTGTYDLPTELFNAKFGKLVSNAAESDERIITFGLRR